MTQNQIAYFGAKEQQRHNYAMEAETARHNYATESLSHDQNEINRTHYSFMDNESQRANLARESLTREELGIKRAQVNLGYAELGETKRHNESTERIQAFNAREDKRHNLKVESQQDYVNGSVVNKNLQEAYLYDYQGKKAAKEYEILTDTAEDQKIGITAQAGKQYQQWKQEQFKTSMQPFNEGINNASSLVGTLARGLIGTKQKGLNYSTN